MNLTMLSLEGDKDDQKVSSVQPVNVESYHVVEIFMNYLPRIDLDGSNKLVIYFKQRPVGESQYVCDREFNVSWYYISNELFEIYKTITSTEKEIFYLNIVKESLKEIARINGRSNEIVNAIEQTAEKVLVNGFKLCQCIKRLSKCASVYDYKVDVFRCISYKGEIWYIEIIDKNKRRKKVRIMQDYAHISKVDFFKKSRWNGDVFELVNRFDKVVAAVDTQECFENYR